MSDAVGWMANSLKAVSGEMVTYSRGGEYVSLTVIPGQYEADRESSEGLTTEDQVFDFLIVADELKLSGEAVEPESGDCIELSGKTYIVFSPGGTEPSWRHTDQTRKIYRVHTREI